MDMVMQYMPLVKSIAKQHMYCGLPYEDLVQEGVIGLIKAINGFDPMKGKYLAPYARKWIRGQILEAITKNKPLILSDELEIPEEVDYTIQYELDLLPKRLARLDNRQRYVINRRWLSVEPAKLRELSAELGISMERVRQIEVESIEEMRDET